MSVVDFIMEMLFILFVMLMTFLGLLAVGAILASALFLLIALGGWFMTIQNRGAF